MTVTFKMRSDKNPQDVEFTSLWDKAVERYQLIHGLDPLKRDRILTVPVNDIWSCLHTDSTLTDIGGGYYQVKQHFGVEE